MKANKDKLKSFEQFMHEDAMVNGSKSKYSFENFCLEHGLFKGGKEYKAGGVWIVCPFHEDYSPSLSFNEERGIWHCMGCGLGGTFPDFIYFYETRVVGKTISYYSFINNVLKEDSIAQARLGFASIFEEEIHKIEQLEPLDKFVFRRGSRVPDTYLELQEKLKNPTMEQIKMVILAMQKGLPIKQVYEDCFNPVKETKHYDLSKMDDFGEEDSDE